ncbi:DUF4199 domain-containing protein [Flavivirga spongiicola]|uniref:DUF4199 domain-containing protein n=1 Tax=Flavivirga spongiicola TaxID=421621 RepID=A0ABU7XUH5_9FLAO|nr:DUF4199 domain-containing protein [Flavivirga sp. MEBiC05379]MDO5979228.1 DUF4199 domain-containing protein [Flavivirga sp. MEBiC05379]
MQGTIKKFGGYAALVGGLIFIGGHFLDWNVDFGTLEILGYASIFASLSFVFFGIKHFRDQINNGVISFKKALFIGLAISAISGIVIGLLDVVYVTMINPDFVVEYKVYALEGMKNTLSATEFELEKATLEEQMKLFESPVFAGLIMFTIVFAIGIIVSLLSSLILQRKN